MMRMLFLLALLVASTGLASAQSPPPAATASEPKMLADRAMKYLAANDLKGMFKYIRGIMPIDQADLDKTLETSISQRKTFPSKLGEYIGYAFISECRRFDQLSRVVFIEKRAKNFIRWEFVFYKPREKWQLSAFYWDTKTAEVFANC